MNPKKIEYFAIGNNGKNWIKSDYDPTKKQVKIYDFIGGKMIEKGIGQY